jgi:hypothetical protein
MRIVVATMALLNIAGGVAFFGLAVILTEPLAGFGIVLLAQGGYTILFLAGKLQRFGSPAETLLVAGATLALVLGTLGTIHGVIISFRPDPVVPGLAAVAAAVLVTSLGLATLVATVSSPAGTTVSSPGGGGGSGLP